MTIDVPSDDQPLSIGFDAFWWTSGPPSGRNVLHSLVNEWRKTFPNDQLHLWVPHSERSGVVAAMDPDIRVHSVRSGNHALAVLTEMRKSVKGQDLDAVITQNYSPFNGSRCYVFVHDALFRTNPDWFTFAERIYFSLIPPLARRAKGVITSSMNEAARIQKEFGLRHVRPIGLGYSDNLRKVSPTKPSALVSDRFILTVSRLNIRKNLKVLLDSVELGLATADRPLVVVGETSGRDLQELESGSHPEQVEWLGHVPDAELRWLYENADAFVFPSLDEGYGMPPIEASLFGCPVAVSDRPIFHETLGTLAEYFDPATPDDVVRGTLRTIARGRRGNAAQKDSWKGVVQRLRARILEDL